MLQTLCELNSIISLDKFNSIISYFKLEAPQFEDEAQLDMFVDSVNVERLGNFPIKLSSENIKEIYTKIAGNTLTCNEC